MEPPPPSTTSEPPPPPALTPSEPPSPPANPPPQSTEPTPPNLNPNQTIERPPPRQQPQSQPPAPQVPRPRVPTQSAPRVGGGMAVGVPSNFSQNQPQSISSRPQQQMQPPAPFTSAFRSASSTPMNNSSFNSSAFGTMPRPSASSSGGPDSISNQVRQQPVPGVQTIGMIGSLSTPSATSTQVRQYPTLSQGQQRLGQQSLVRAASPSSNQALMSQRFQGHAAPRGPSITSPSTQPPTSQSAQSLHQQFLQSQQKQMNPSSPYRPPIRPPTIQQRPQHQTPLTSQQQRQQQQQLMLQHNQQISLPNQSLQSIPLPNQRAIVPTTPKLDVQASVPPGSNNDADEMSDDIISRKRIRELVTQVDKSETLRPEIEDDLLEIADDFVDSIVTAACQLAKHRKSTTLEAKDILLHVERRWHMTLPGFSSDEIKCYKKPPTNDIHKERLAMIKKSMVGSSHDNTKTPATGLPAANPKPQSAKPPAVGSPK